MKKYEIVIIINPEIEENEATKSIESVMAEHKVTVSKLDVWGLRTLAYPIQHNEQGRYYAIEFETEDTSVVENINQEFRINESVLRFTINVK